MERFVRGGGCDANSRQRAPAHPLRGGSKSKTLLNTHTPRKCENIPLQTDRKFLYGPKCGNKTAAIIVFRGCILSGLFCKLRENRKLQPGLKSLSSYNYKFKMAWVVPFWTVNSHKQPCFWFSRNAIGFICMLLSIFYNV